VSEDRVALLEQALAERVLCLDGATGTFLQKEALSAADFGGEAYEGCNEQLVVTRPDIIRKMHGAYLEAGADIVETDTFGSTALVLAEYDLQDHAYTLTRRAAELARECADAFSAKTPGKPRFVAGSIGPTTKAISVTGGVTFDTLVDNFREQSRALLDGGADYLLVETCQDTRNVKAALLGIQQLAAEQKRKLPVAVSGTIEPMGTMLAGQTAEAFAISVSHVDLLYVGLNCATGPAFMADPIRALSDLARTRVACVPNAGLPDEDGKYGETPAMMAQVLSRFLQHGWLNLVGGCCGTTPAHVAAMAQLARDARPRPIPSHHRTLWSGIDWVEATDDNRPLLVGERTNVIGSRKFKRLIVEEKWEEAAEIGRAQVKGGAHVVDVCLANPDRDEKDDVERLLEKLVRVVKAPLMIDTTDKDVLATALTYCQGKGIVNSINLEDGLERFEQIVPLARRFGASFVVGCIDEDKQQGMAVTRQRKLEIAKRSYDLLVHEFGVPAEDIVFDPLVFPCATGDVNYLGSARETVEGIRLIKQHLPDCKTILGISNVSFGLPDAAREVVNSVFLYENTKAGLDLAIVNTEKLERYASIPDHERRLAERVLFDTSDEAVAELVAHFRESSGRKRESVADLPLDERLARYVVEGTKEGLIPDLDKKLAEAAPLDIINGPLMAGMDEVGRLFNGNQLIVAEVLQSAEVMKAAVAHLEPHMEKSSAASRGKIVLATVKGDVHDIGKNLVEIILSNNGFEVVNLGIKVPPGDLIQAVRRHKPDAVGLSGLLVKSAQMMVVTAEEMTAAGCTPDLLVGGAALTRSFTRKRIAAAYGGRVLYANDAMDGLSLANRLVDAGQSRDIDAMIAAESEKFRERDATEKVPSSPRDTPDDITPVDDLPMPPDWDRHVLQRVPLDEIWGWINPKMLYGKHLGFRGDFDEALRGGDETAISIAAAMETIRGKARGGALTGRAVWQWFDAERDGETMIVYRHRGTDALARFPLPRQAGGIGLCDYLRREGRDVVGMFVVGFGDGARAWSETLKADGQFLLSHAVQAVALEAAEGLAEWLHARMRGQWGFPDAPDTTMPDRFKAKYRGKRYSPGYPACPDLALQAGLFAALRPDEIGVTLTDGFMMEPEASVSAFVLHHPQARYFGAG
jgi:5-methyltetrahydrofolate--homocysteine methyltransferase